MSYLAFSIKYLIINNLTKVNIFNYKKSNCDKKTMQTAEIKNGRLAMIAITAFAFQEFATGVSVVQETPYLF